MELNLQNKRALITGSSSGIGEAIAKTLAREGAFVVIHGRNEQRARQVADEIVQNGGKAAVAIGDLSQDDSAEKVAKDAIQAFGGIDILINNAVRAIAAANGWNTDNWEELETRTAREIWPNPTGRVGRVEDVANLAAYLASPLSGFINGANYRVDGGNITAIN